MDGIAVAARATADAPVTLAADAYRTVDTGDPLPPAPTRSSGARTSVAETARRSSARCAPYTHVRQVGEDVAAGDLVFPAGRPASAGRPRRRRVGRGDVRRRSGGARSSRSCRRATSSCRSAPSPAPARSSRPTRSCWRRWSRRPAASQCAGRSSRTTPSCSTAALAQAAAEADLVLLVAGSAKGRGDHAVAVIDGAGSVVVQGVAIRPGHPVVLGLTGSTPVIGVPGYPVSAALAFELFGIRLLAALGDLPAGATPTVRAIARSRSRRRPGARSGFACASGGSAATSSRCRCDAAQECSARSPAPTASSACRSARAASTPARTSTSSCSARSQAIEAALLVAGSTDPLLDHLAPLLAPTRSEPGWPVLDPDGSANGAAALAAGRCHLALVDSRTTSRRERSRWRAGSGRSASWSRRATRSGSTASTRSAARGSGSPTGSQARRRGGSSTSGWREHAIDPGDARGLRARGALARGRRGRGRRRRRGLRCRGARRGHPGTALGFVPLETAGARARRPRLERRPHDERIGRLAGARLASAAVPRRDRSATRPAAADGPTPVPRARGPACGLVSRLPLAPERPDIEYGRTPWTHRR